MTMQELKIFEEKQVRTIWDEVQEKWYFCIIDIVQILTESKDYHTARKYWNKLKQRLVSEGNETVTNCHQLKLRAADGKLRYSDVADLEQMLRLVQSIPSKKAEPKKRWLAEVGAERIKQMQDPELGIQQYLMDYKRLRFFATLVQPYLFVFIVIASFLRSSFAVGQSYVLQLSA